MADLTNQEIATLALYAAGGSKQLIHLEDVAIEAGRIAPGVFSWQKYPDRIDKELVRIALSRAVHLLGYASGSSRESGGWMLTPEGVRFAESTSTAISKDSPRAAEEARAASRERGRLTSTRAYGRYSAGDSDSFSQDEADEFFRLDVYIKGNLRESKIRMVENEFSDDPDLGPLVRALAPIARSR